jgi:WhiB family transcriptional regulator, redox-sensing transcriptional regulator
MELRTNRGVGPPAGSPISLPPERPSPGPRENPKENVVAIDTLSSIVFTGPLSWTVDAACEGRTELFFAPAGERPEARVVRENKARAICTECPVLEPCRDWAREQREYGFWGGESEEERAAAGFRVDMPVGRVARYPKGNGKPVQPRTPRVA